MRILLLGILSFLSLHVYAINLDLKPYINLQEKLAADDLKGSLAAFKSTCESLKKLEAKACKKEVKSLSDIRENFKSISELYITNMNSSESGHIVVKCPMANARWIQKDGDIHNPYFGSEMLMCGEVVSK